MLFTAIIHVAIFFFIICVALDNIGLVNSLSSPSSPAAAGAAAFDELAKTIHNLNAIVSHIQNPELYSPAWANQIEFHRGNTKQPIAKCDISKGELITLYPIQYISVGTKETQRSQSSPSSSDQVQTIRSKRVELLQEERYPYPHLRVAPDQPLYIHSEKHVIYSEGWYGNIIPSATTNEQENYEGLSIRSNCMFVPLPSVAPLCGMVATRSIAKGEAILSSACLYDEESSHDKTKLYQLTNHIAKEYADKLGDLMPYLQMAYTQTHMDTKKTSETIAKKQQLYHTINESYPNLQQIHSSPDIYTVTDFLSQDECDRIIRKARLNIQPCLVKNEDTGAVEVDPSRTSTNANIPRCEVPSITKKIVELGNCVEEQMETLQVLNYKRGQEFKPHTDGFDGATTACGFQDSGRIATVFCYLNDVKAGGTTLFHKVGLEIEPKQGMAVVHFPMSLDLVEDEMTEHQGSVAIDEKWILTTWIWKNWKADYRYAEENIEALSDDII